MPLMISIQMLSARIGWVTVKGLVVNINKIAPRWITVTLVGLLLVGALGLVCLGFLLAMYCYAGVFFL
jgi:Mn2+/Fe2+ NRAMP family transporter